MYRASLTELIGGAFRILFAPQHNAKDGSSFAANSENKILYSGAAKSHNLGDLVSWAKNILRQRE